MSQCTTNIANLIPPGVYCPGDYCAQIQPDINTYCKSHNMGPDEPYAGYIPGFGKCYCCCSCFAYGTPIEVQPDLYKLIEAIGVGDRVLATGPSLGSWNPAEVTTIGGIAVEVQVDFMLLGQFQLENGELRLLIASADHLFLNGDPAGATLVPFAQLRPGHKVRGANGGIVTVLLTSYIQFKGGVRHIGLGPYVAGEPLDGHLLNSNGLVTADLSVQLNYYADALPETMVARAAPDVPAIGSAEFHARYDTSAYTAFVNDPEQWPPNCVPITHGLIHVPASALGYFTPEQADDIERAMGMQNLGNSMLLTQALYAFDIFGAFYPTITFIADWASLTPNAWYFMDYRQTYIVVSGGLLRAPGLMLQGLSVVLSHLVANSRGVGCTADADWEGIRNEMREVWYNDLFFQMAEPGIPQVEQLFALVSPEHAGGDPNNVCRSPSLPCRVEALWAGLAMSALPQCAVPPPDFAVAGAEARGLNAVRVLFSAAYNQPSASNPGNYVFAPEGRALAVTFDGLDAVLLTVDGLIMNTEYTVTVSHVFSVGGKPLTPAHDSATFRTSGDEGGSS